MLLFIEFFCAAMVFLLGLVVGSFLNVCIYRIPLKITIVYGRSFCPTCGHTLAWYDLAPVASYCILGGRCRYCGEKISPRYPAIELLNALLWLACYAGHGLTVGMLLRCLCLSGLVVAAMIDHDTGEIPDGISLFLAALAALSLFLPGFPGPLARLAGALCVSGPMLAAALLCDGFGGGDIKLCAAFGLLLGWKLSLLAMLVASVSGGLWALWLLARRKAGRKTAFPFGPFLAAGMSLAVICGDKLTRWYLSLFLL